MRSKDCSQRERDLLKLVSDNEITQSILGDVKVGSVVSEALSQAPTCVCMQVSTPGLHASFNAKRAVKKKGKGGKK